jgi:hypothetical protein
MAAPKLIVIINNYKAILSLGIDRRRDELAGDEQAIPHGRMPGPAAQLDPGQGTDLLGRKAIVLVSERTDAE